MSGTLKKFPEPGGLTKEQVASVISSLAEFEDRVDIVREEFEALWEKKISADIVYQIRARYEAQILAKRKLITEDLNNVPLARRSYRLTILHKLIKWGMKPRPRFSVKVGKDEFEVQDLPDVRLILNATLAAEKIMSEAKRLELEEFRLLNSLRGGMGDDDEDETSDDVDFDEPEANEQPA